MSKPEIDTEDINNSNNNNPSQTGGINKVRHNEAARALHITRSNKRPGPGSGAVKALKSPTPAASRSSSSQSRVPNTLKAGSSVVVVQDASGRIVGKGKIVEVEGTKQVVLDEADNFDPLFSDYQPRTRLGQTLKNLRARAIGSGMPLLTHEQIQSQVDLIKGRPTS